MTTALKILHNRRFLALLTLFLTLSQAISADNTEWNADNIVLPHVSDPMRYVSNPDNVVTEETEKVVNNIMRHMDTELGIESAVIIVNHVQNQDVYSMAQSLFNKYGIGKNDRGLVIILAFDDRVIRTHTGKALEADLPDITCSRLQNKYAILALQASNPDKAIVRLTSAIFYHLKGLPIPNLENDTLVSESFLNNQNALYTTSEQADNQSTETDTQPTEDIPVGHSAERDSHPNKLLLGLVLIASFMAGTMIRDQKKEDKESFVSKYHVHIIIGCILISILLFGAIIFYNIDNPLSGLCFFAMISFTVGFYIGGKDDNNNDRDYGDYDFHDRDYRESRSSRDYSDRGGYSGGGSGGGGASSRW